jgi:PAS domain S-box-containing protein
MTSLTNAFLLAIDLVVLCALVLWLHRLSPKYGLAPLITCIAAIVTIVHTLGPLGAYVQAGPNLVLVIGSTVLVPAALLGVLVIYAVQGTAAARVTIFAVVGVSVLALGLHLIQGEHLALPGGGNVAQLPPDSPAIARSAAITTGSLTAFALSLSVIVIVYQAVTNRFPNTPPWVTPGLALLAAMWTDTIVFNVVAFGPAGSFAGIQGALVGKTLSAVVAWPVIGWYMTRVAPGLAGYEVKRDRGSLDLLFGTYGRQAEVLSLTEAARQLTEDELRRAQATISTIVSNAPILFFALDIEGVFTLSEGKGLEVLGLEPGQVVGTSVFDLYPEARDDIRRVMSGEAVRSHVSIGPLVWETVFTPVLAPDGSVLGATGVATDMTERVRAEGALKESERRFRSTFEQAAVGIAHVGLHGSFERANRRLAEILGYEQDQLLSLDLQAIDHPHNVDSIDDWTATALSGEHDPFIVETQLAQKNGEATWVTLTVSPLRDDRGEPTSYVMVVEDITDRRATEEQLRQAQKMEVVGQLTGGVAHDFNNLMTVIMGGLELARADVSDDSPVTHALETALAATRRGASLTQRLLAFSRRQTLRPTAVELGSMLRDMEHLLSTTVGESIQLRFRITDDLWPLAADRPQMENAILNLALNARDAMPDGGILTIEVSNVELEEDALVAPSGPGDYVLVKITDEGVGMTADVLERAFEPFFTTKDVGKGSGLGLSMVYGFVKQSGGHVQIDSVVGYGTTIRMHMPRGSGTERGPKGRDHGEPRGADQLILVVEDDEAVRRLVIKLLERLGYRCIEAEDAQGALKLVDQRSDIDLLFTDIILPGGTSGAGLADEVRRRRPNLPVVFTTGYSRDALPADGKLGSRVDLVEKPYEKAHLARVLHDALGR